VHVEHIRGAGKTSGWACDRTHVHITVKLSAGAELQRCSWGTRMRFSLSDWLRLILSCIAAPAAMAIVTHGRGELLSLGGGYVHTFIRWATLAAIGVACFVPPGLLLQRLSRTSCVPLVAVAAVSMMATALIAALLELATPPHLMRIALSGDVGVWALLGMLALPFAAGLVSGAFSGLAQGAGLFLMARLPARLA